jgi:medium-chain acyl-[acyl-carrier-protein] hydrolase
MADWLVTRRAHSPVVCRLVCLPNAGAGMMTFRGWQNGLPDMELALAHLPGRDERRDEPLPTSIQEIAAALVDALRLQPARPVALFGHSMGALIAFEMAHQLEAAGATELVALVVSGRRGPRTAPRFPPLAHLPADEFVRGVQQRYGGIPETVLKDEELRALFLPTLQADMHLVDDYVAGDARRLACPIFAYGGTMDGQTNEAELRAWSTETSGAFRQRWFAGGHFFIESARQDVLAALRQDLASVASRAGQSPR